MRKMKRKVVIPAKDFHNIHEIMRRRYVISAVEFHIFLEISREVETLNVTLK